MKYLLTGLLVISGLLLQAQDSTLQPLNIQPGLVEFNGGMYNGNTTDVNAPADMIENAIKENFKAQGIKPKEIKGFMVFRNARIDKIDATNPVDAFLKVERKGKRDDNMSTISFITTPAGQISDDKLKSGVATATVTPAATTGVFLSDLMPDIDNKVFEKQVADQQEDVKKAEKKLKDLQDDQASMEKKIRNLQDDLENNRKDQQKQAAELEKKRNALNLLLSQKPDGAGALKKD